MHSGQSVEVLLRRNVVTGMAFAFRASARDLLEFMPASWIHDGWLALGIALRAKLVAVPDKLVGYRVHGTQQVGTPLSPAGKLHALGQNGLRHYLDRLHARNLDEYQRTVVLFDELLKWLRSQKREHPALSLVEAKAAHARRGARALTLGRMKRWPILVPHAGSYRHFSPNGPRGLPRDLFI